MKRFIANLPKQWVEAELADTIPNPKSAIVDGPFGSNLKASEYQDQGVPIIRLQNIDRNRFLVKNIKYISAEKACELVRHSYVPGDVVITKLGAPLGKATIVPREIMPGVIVADVVRARVDENFSDPKYITYAINSPSVAEQFITHTKGTTRPRVNLKHIRSIRLPVAPLNEQHRIVEKIETLFARLDKGEEAVRQVQKLLGQYRQSILKAAVTGELTADWRAERKGALESGKDLLACLIQTRQERTLRRNSMPVTPIISDMPAVPEHWIWASLDTLVYDGPTNGISPKAVPHESGAKSFKLTATTSGRFLINDNTVKVVGIKLEADSKYWLKKGDVLVQRGNTIDYVGTAAIFPGPDNEYIYPDLMMRLRFTDELLARWATAWMNFDFAKRYFKKNATGTAGNMPKINSATLKALAVPIPPRSEIEQCIDLIEAEFARNEPVTRYCVAELKRSAALRQSILKDAFSGRLVPQDPNDEPASELLARIKAAKDDAPKRTRKRKSI